MVTVHSRESGSSGASGGGSMFGPRTISMPCASSGDAGARIWRSSTAGFAGASGRSGYSPSSRGSVITPRKAVATAVVGLVRYTWSVIVPERPGKLRLKVLTLTDSEGGACPIPTQGPHWLEHPSARPHQVRVDAGTGDGVEDLSAPRRHCHDETGIDRLVPQDRSSDGKVLEAGVYRATDADLRSLRPRHLSHGDDGAGRVGPCDQGNQLLKLC